jgi:ATP-binding cassette subfamily C protein LapB
MGRKAKKDDKNKSMADEVKKDAKKNAANNAANKDIKAGKDKQFVTQQKPQIQCKNTTKNSRECCSASTIKVDNRLQENNVSGKNTWKFSFESKAPYDPLLGCLLILSKLNNKSTSAQALTSGLPLVNHRLTPELFKRAAARIGLSTKIINRRLSEITPQELPVVLFLNDTQVCILSDIGENGIVKIIQPETGEGYAEITLEELAKNYIGYAIFSKPIYHFNKNKEEKARSKHWFWSVIKRALPIYSEVLIASFLINIFSIASPLFVMNVYDRVVPNAAIGTLWVLAIGVIIVFAFDFIMRNLRAYFIDTAGKKIDVQMSGNTFEQLMGLQMDFRPNSVGSLTNTVHSFESFREFITSATVSLLIDIPFAFLFIAVIMILGGSIALVPLIMIPVMLLVSFLVQIPLNHLVESSHQFAAEKQAVLFESLAGVETIKGVRAEGLMQRKWETLIRALAKLGVKLHALANLGTNFSIYAQHMTVVGVVIVGVYKISAGDLTTGALIACVILAGRTLSPISQFAVLMTRYKQSKTSLGSLDNIMNMPVERPYDKVFLHRPKLKGSIEFKNVDFCYPNQVIPALNKVSFSIKPSERVGIIGRTGSGKSTIEKLMLKLYQASSGTILVDKTEIQQLDPAELRYHIGYIPQDVVLFRGTIRENVVIGAPYVDDTAVMRVARLSGVDTFVNQHPQGFDRQIYERGQNLSGGQRQAIAIARALLLDPPILIFDEPFNGIDDTTVAYFFKHLNEYLTNKTLILVTHKASLLNLVNRLIVIEGGRIIVDGPKQEVLEKLSGNIKAQSGGQHEGGK